MKSIIDTFRFNLLYTSVRYSFCHHFPVLDLSFHSTILRTCTCHSYQIIALIFVLSFHKKIPINSFPEISVAGNRLTYSVNDTDVFVSWKSKQENGYILTERKRRWHLSITLHLSTNKKCSNILFREDGSDYHLISIN